MLRWLPLVVCEQQAIWRASSPTGNDIRGTVSNQHTGDSGGRGTGIALQVQRDAAGDVGCGHGGAANRVGGSVAGVPGRGDAGARRKEIQTGAPVHR